MKAFTFLAIIFFLTSCNLLDTQRRLWSELPEVTSLAHLKHTEFVAALENPVSGEKNIIYASAFLYAWDELKKELKHEVLVSDSNSSAFKVLASSTSHLNSLNPEEYSVSAEQVNGAVITRAFFNKTLPFETSLKSLNAPIRFDNTNVSAFGMDYFDYDAVKFTKILFYRNDDHFVLKLSPEDKEHEILLVKGLNDFKSLAQALQQTNALLEKGRSEAGNNAQAWKYTIKEEDIFSIPKVAFNIEANYKNLAGQTFTTQDNQKHLLKEAYQRTGFILNENGAVAESEALIVADSTGIELTERHPKKMIFDRPFLIIVRRTKVDNPYLVVYIQNSELLTRQ